MKKKVLFALIALFSVLSTWAQQEAEPAVAQGYPVQTEGINYKFYLSTQYVVVGEAAPTVLDVESVEGTTATLLDPDSWSQDGVAYSKSGTVMTKVTSLTNVGTYYLHVNIGEGQAAAGYYVPFTVGTTEHLETEWVWNRDTWEASQVFSDGSEGKKMLYFHPSQYPFYDLYKAATEGENPQPEFAGNLPYTYESWQALTAEQKEAALEGYSHDWFAIAKSSVNRDKMFPQLTYIISDLSEGDAFNVVAKYKDAEGNWKETFTQKEEGGAITTYAYIAQAPKARQYWMINIPMLFAGKLPMASGQDEIDFPSQYRLAFAANGEQINPETEEPLAANATLADAVGANLSEEDVKLLLVPAERDVTILNDDTYTAKDYDVTVAPTTPYNGDQTQPTISVKLGGQKFNDYTVKYFLEDEEVTRLNVKEVELADVNGVQTIAATKSLTYTAKVYVGGDVVGQGNFTVTPQAQLTVRLAQIYPVYNQPAYGDYAVTSTDYKSGDNATNVNIIGDFSITNLADFKFTDQYYEYTIDGSTVKAISVLDDKTYQNYAIKLVTDAQSKMTPANLLINISEDDLSKIYGDKDPEEYGIEAQMQLLDENKLPTGETEDLQEGKVKFIVEREEGEDAGTYDIFVTLQELLPVGDTDEEAWQGTQNFNVASEGFVKVLKQNGKWDTGKWKLVDGFTINKRTLNSANVVITTNAVDYNAKAQEVKPASVIFIDENGVLSATNQSNPYTAADAEGNDLGFGYVTIVESVAAVADDPATEVDESAPAVAKDYTVGNWSNNTNVTRNLETAEVQQAATFTITAEETSVNFKDSQDGAFQINPVALDLKVKDYVKVSETVDNSKPYGTDPFNYGVEVDPAEGKNGFVADESADNQAAVLTAVAAAITTEGYEGYQKWDPVGVYPISVKETVANSVAVKLAANNYNVAFAGGNLQIKAIDVTVTAKDQNGAFIVQDGTDANENDQIDEWEKTYVIPTIATTADQYTVSGVTELPEGVVISLSCGTSKVGDSNVIAVNVEVPGSVLGNYNFTTVDGKFIVAKLNEIHLAYGNVAQVLEDHKGLEGIDVYLPARDLATDKWNSIILPFEFRAATLSNKLWYGMIEVLDTDDESQNYKFQEIVNGNVKANEPFILKIAAENATDEVAKDKAALCQIKFDDVTISDKDANGDEVVYNDPSKWPFVEDAYGNKFIGQYTGKTGLAADEWAIATKLTSSNLGKFVYGGAATTNTYFEPTVAFLKNKGETPSAGANIRIFVEEDGVETAIDGVEAGEEIAAGSAAEGWYTISGVKLEGEPTTSGTYIFNGKKVFIQK